MLHGGTLRGSRIIRAVVVTLSGIGCIGVLRHVLLAYGERYEGNESE